MTCCGKFSNSWFLHVSSGFFFFLPMFLTIPDLASAQRRQPLDVRGALLGATGLWGRIQIIQMDYDIMISTNIEEVIHHVCIFMESSPCPTCPCPFFSCVLPLFCPFSIVFLCIPCPSHTHMHCMPFNPSMFSLNISAIGVWLSATEYIPDCPWWTLWIVATCRVALAWTPTWSMVGHFEPLKSLSRCHGTLWAMAWEPEALGSIGESQRKPRPKGRVHKLWIRQTGSEQILRSIEEHSYGYKPIKQ